MKCKIQEMSVLPCKSSRRTKRAREQHDEWKYQCPQRLASGWETVWGSIPVCHQLFSHLFEAPCTVLGLSTSLCKITGCSPLKWVSAKVLKKTQQRWGGVTGCDILFARLETTFGDWQSKPTLAKALTLEHTSFGLVNVSEPRCGKEISSGERR